MPYANVDELPDYVKKLPDTKRRQWMHVFNSCAKGGGDEARCFRMANGVVKKSIGDDDDFDPGDYGIADDAELIEALVERLAPIEPELIFDTSARTRATSVKTFLSKLLKPTKAPPVTTTLAVLKQADGRLRWFARYSNAWEDRDQEILTEEAHKDYIAWAYDTGTFPELWLWHTGGTRFGQADWLDFSDGFAHASGLIDNGKESVVEAISTKDVGVSHGFLSLQQGKYIRRYRTYEISVLPRDYAAVETSGFNVLSASKGSDVMAFTDEKRKWLIDALGEDAVASLEKSTAAMADQLKQLGVEYKQSEETKADAEAAQTEGFKALASQVADLTQSVAQLASVVGVMKKDVDTVKKTDDEKIEDAFLAKVAKAFGQNGGAARPTESSNNIKSSDTPQAPVQSDFFSEMINKQLASLGPLPAAGSVGMPATGTVTVQGGDGPQEVR